MEQSTVSPMRDSLTRAMLSVLGGTLAIIGALITWATVRPRSESEPLDPSVVRGLDLPEGWIALIIAIAMVVAAAVLVVGSPRLRGRLAVGMLAASIAVAGIGAIDAIAGRDRLEAAGLDRTAARISETSGLPFEPVRRRLGEQLGSAVDESLGAGLILVMVGGVLGATGSLGLLEKSRRRMQPSDDHGRTGSQPRSKLE